MADLDSARNAAGKPAADDPAGRPPASSAATAAAAFEHALSAQAIRAALGAAAPIGIEAVAETLSTNDDLLERARLAAPHQPCVRAALHQLAGRGRHGRRWHGARGRALLFSVAVPYSADPASVSAVTLACGIAAAETLREHGVEARLKWPNDLLLSERKLGGILTELAFDPAGRASLVVGLGLNLCLDPETRVAIDQPAAALDERVPEARLAAERELWIARLARALLDAVERFERDGFEPFRARFEQLFAYAGRGVVLVQPNQPPLSGVAVGVDAEGRLLLSTGSGIQAVTSGELSLRPQGPGGS